MRDSAYSSSQRGLTLIELMVAMVISILIVIVAASFYLSSSRIRATQDSAAQLQDTGRYITEILTKNIQQAGFQNYMWSSTAGSSLNREPLNGVNPDGTAMGPDISGFNNSAAGAGTDNGLHNRNTDRVNNSDTLAIRFQGMSSTVTTGTGTASVTSLVADGSMIDCRGISQPAPVGTPDDRVYSVFEVRMNGTEPELRCKYKDRTTPNTYISEVVARGVEVFQVMYGMDFNNDSFPDQWLNAEEVDAVANRWNLVRAVRIGMVIRSLDRSTVNDTAVTYKPLGENFTSTAAVDPGSTFTAPNDGRLRRVVTFTVNLRNSL